jgi:hypothetical protein
MTTHILINLLKTNTMLTDNQQSIIDSITQEFLTFNEQRKVVNKPFNFFDTSVLDSENEYSKEQIEEAVIINRSVVKQLSEIVKADYTLMAKDFEKIYTRLSSTINVDSWDGLPTSENETNVGAIFFGRGDYILRIDYVASGQRLTAANGKTYVLLNGGYRVINLDSRNGNIVEPTLSDLFANEKFVQKVTRLYRECTK